MSLEPGRVQKMDSLKEQIAASKAADEEREREEERERAERAQRE